MSATNKTTHYELPSFLGSDKPAWLVDWNGAMAAIDAAIYEAKQTADGAATQAATNASDISSLTTIVNGIGTDLGVVSTSLTTLTGTVNTITSLIGNGEPTTTDKTLIGAINELHADQGALADLTTTVKTSIVNAINSLVSGKVDKQTEYVEVVTDGVKTMSEIYDELFALVDQSKMTSNAYMQEIEIANPDHHTFYHIDAFNPNAIFFLPAIATNPAASMLTFYPVVLRASDSGVMRFEITPTGVTFANRSANVYPNGYKVRIYY